ncbi:metallophosphoesterase [Fodinicola feengrottensis]|uniref:Metallophosphoesterase n=1 Tax=Fodinicola feengrottensis TaxID=435914 RepID=A0ABP4UDS2_9ACTN
MRVHVVSDVHGNAAALAKAGDGADAVFVLGDLLDAVDYRNPAGGIMGKLYGAEGTARWIELRTARRFEEARAFSRTLLAEVAAARDLDPKELLAEAIRANYEAVFAAMPTPAWCTYGNVDAPEFWSDYLPEGVQVVDGGVAEIDGIRVGFVGGGIGGGRSSYPYLMPEDDYTAKVEALGPVDVLCSHIPPAAPELCYDTVARRFEKGSEALLAAIREHQPRVALFGHVHQPLQQRMRIGRTECVNVGHFRETQLPYALTW